MPKNTRVYRCVKKLLKSKKHTYSSAIPICQKSTKQSYKTGRNLPVDKELYERIKKKIYKSNPIHSAYRSGAIVKKYKEEFEKKYGNNKQPYYGKKSLNKGLSRWFREKWKTDSGKNTYNNNGNVFRPTVRITRKTPKTFSELTQKEIKNAKKEKRQTGRVKKF